MLHVWETWFPYTRSLSNTALRSRESVNLKNQEAIIKHNCLALKNCNLGTQIKVAIQIVFH